MGKLKQLTLYRYASATDILNFTIVNNMAPQHSGTLPAIKAVELTAGSYNIPDFTDPDNDPVGYSVTFGNGTALDASWISFNSTKRVIRYTPPANITLYKIKIIAQDEYNTPTEEIIDLNVDLKPRVNNSINPVSGTFIANEPSSFSINAFLFSDEEEVNDLVYTIDTTDNTVAPGWLNLVPPDNAGGSFTVSGIAPIFVHKTYDLVIIATDSKGSSVNASLLLEVRGK